MVLRSLALGTDIKFLKNLSCSSCGSFLFTWNFYWNFWHNLINLESKWRFSALYSTKSFYSQKFSLSQKRLFVQSALNIHQTTECVFRYGVICISDCGLKPNGPQCFHQNDIHTALIELPCFIGMKTYPRISVQNNLSVHLILVSF